MCDFLTNSTSASASLDTVLLLFLLLSRRIPYTDSVGQKPLTYFRQVLALCDLPAADGVDHPDIAKVFPADVVARARELRTAIGPSGTGSYTNSQGILDFRKNIAEFIQQRDGHAAYAGNIFLTNGAVRM